MATYQEISAGEMDSFMDAEGFVKVASGSLQGFEAQYDLACEDIAGNGLRIRLFSTIDIRSDAGRGNGSDAMRLVIMTSEGILRGAKFKRVHRVKNWRKNLMVRYNEILDGIESGKIAFCSSFDCPKCGDKVRTLLNNHYKTFMGCSGYRDNGCRQSYNVETGWDIALEQMESVR